MNSKSIAKIVIGGVLCTSFIFTQSAFAATTDTAHHWKFDEGTGRSANDSVGVANGVMSGDAKGFGWASGKVGSAIAFPGVTGMSVALQDNMIKGGVGSLSVWFTLGAQSYGNVLFSARSQSDQSVYMAMFIDQEGRPMLQYRGQVGGVDKRVQAMKALNVNEWYHLVVTANGQNYTMTINGEAVALAGDNIGRWFGEFSNNQLTYRIGALDSSVLPGAFNGTIDDFRLYDRELSAVEAGELYREGNSALSSVPSAILPTLAMNVSDSVVPKYGSVVVRWGGQNLTSCAKGGSWNGSAPTSGSEVITRIEQEATFELTCSGLGGVVMASAGIVVATTSLPIRPSVTPGLSVSVGTPAQSGTVMTPEARKTLLAQIDTLLKLIATLQVELAKLKATQGIR